MFKINNCRVFQIVHGVQMDSLNFHSVSHKFDLPPPQLVFENRWIDNIGSSTKLLIFNPGNELLLKKTTSSIPWKSYTSSNLVQDLNSVGKIVGTQESSVQTTVGEHFSLIWYLHTGTRKCSEADLIYDLPRVNMKTWRGRSRRKNIMLKRSKILLY